MVERCQLLLIALVNGHRFVLNPVVPVLLVARRSLGGGHLDDQRLQIPGAVVLEVQTHCPAIN